MTDERIAELAARFQQYPGSPEITLRGAGIVEFSRALIRELDGEKVAELLSVRAALDGQEDETHALRAAVPESTALIGRLGDAQRADSRGNAAPCGEAVTPYCPPPDALSAPPDEGHRHQYTPPGTHGAAAAPALGVAIPPAWRELYRAINELVAYAGKHGEVSARGDRMSAVEDALYAIDGGTYNQAYGAQARAA
jgi:hypothetical protein